MKKKLIITTAALSLSLTSVAPVTSLAATITQNGTQKICDETHTGKFWVDAVRRGAQSVTNLKGKENVEQIMDILNNAPSLGFLQGNQVKIKIDPPTHKLLNAETEQDTEQGKQEFKYDTKTKQNENDTTMDRIIMDDIWLDRDHSDPSLDISYDSKEKVVTITKLKNIDSTGNLSLATRSCYLLEAWYYDWPFWHSWGDVSGSAVINRIEKKYHNFEKAPKLEVSPYSNVPTIASTDIDKLNPDDYYDALSQAGNAQSEFVERPDPTKIGEQTATIRVWDLYGAETPSDSEHNKEITVKFNVADESTWRDKDLRHWEFQSANKWEIVKDHANSLTDDHAIYSNDSIIAKKKYNLETGATYRFTTLVKPDILSKKDKIALSLIPENDISKKREIFSSNSHDLDKDMDKGFKKVSMEFTVGSDEEDLTFEFFAYLEKGIYIDSFKLEKLNK
ncbi:hypothetical protein [Bacillus thuringiensis]|uniref:hypothetical protein n=1 Tax=Bacillus thuringiensis TaxID=1428 RepID=UPI0026E3052B|nr:hypothetical protein [Bacillus thuringiensis]MDO6631801.1 hypothetical protein [Bacillus thuringiensis]MDO6661368.1 hypothetical protein [Bacillus thuringiensis]MDO6701941.1 hypothetical protein [Bacillus thuringiensis]